MNAIKNTVLALILGMVILFTVSCDPAGPNNTGTEFMPDMGHSLAYEANVYGDIRESNNWDEESTFKVKDLSGPRLPVNGTVPRGYAGISASKGSEVTEMLDVLNGKAPNAVYTPKNGHVGYYYADTEEERTRATAEVIDNPFPIEDARLKEAKELYNIFCGVCHGEKGDGNGYIYETGVYPAAPANFLSEEFIAASNGRYYHAIMHGKNVMGGYADKISFEERWQVIHYIRVLQAKETGTEYSETVNTLNASFGIPRASMVKAEVHEENHDEAHAEDHGSDHGQHASDDHSEGAH
ncbi:MAG: cytochrome c [Saprospiraceae bacterium]|nr:cytochrome c [Saprospiraceae bacterium]